MHLCMYPATRICILLYRGRFCARILYIASICWQRRLKASKSSRMVALDGVRQSLRELDGCER